MIMRLSSRAALKDPTLMVVAVKRHKGSVCFVTVPTRSRTRSAEDQFGQSVERSRNSLYRLLLDRIAFSLCFSALDILERQSVSINQKAALVAGQDTLLRQRIRRL